jgi:hypothetical protein
MHAHRLTIESRNEHKDERLEKISEDVGMDNF